MKKKKKQKNRQNKKPRQHVITLDMGRPVAANGLSIDPKTGKASLLFNGRPLLPVQANIEVSYNRNKGPKSLVNANTNPSLLYPNPNRVLEQFDLIIAVDTNWKDVDGERIAVTATIYGRNTKIKVREHTSIEMGIRQCFEYRNPACKPENLGWQQIIEMLQRNPEYNKTMKVALIVDSDLNMLKDYNKRLKPVIDGFYLPENFELIYASAESSSESIANQMIAKADSISRTLLNQIIKENDPSNLILVDNQPFSHCRKWDVAVA